MYRWSPHSVDLGTWKIVLRKIWVSRTVLKTSKAHAISNFCTWYLQLWCNHSRFLFSLKITLWKFFIHLWFAFKDTKMLRDNFRFFVLTKMTRIVSIDAKVEVTWECHKILWQSQNILTLIASILNHILPASCKMFQFSL